jgi:hypothetical protein
LNNSNILALIGYGTGKTKYETLYNTAVGAIIITIFVSFPVVYHPRSADVHPKGIVGNFIGIFLPDILGG